MIPIGRKYEVSDEPVPGYRLTRLLPSGSWEVGSWEAVGPDGGQVRLTVIGVDEASQLGLLEWFALLPRFRQVVHHNLLPLPDLWLRTEDGRLLKDLPSACCGPSAQSGPSQSLYAAEQAKTLTADLRPVEAIEIDALSLRYKTPRDRLRECRERGQRGIPWQDLIRYMEGAAKAIDYLHQPVHDLVAGPTAIIHGSVRPHNMLIVGDTVQLADWANLARWKAFEVQGRVTPSAMVRTIAYAAPELLAGRPDPASDQYSLAVSYTALRTCGLPYRKGTNPSQMMELIHRGELDFSGLMKPERRIIQKAASLDPVKRWPSCTYMVRALRDAIAS